MNKRANNMFIMSTRLHHMCLVKRKSAFEHAQNVRIHINMHMRKLSSGHLLSIETFYSIQWFCLQTAKALIRLRGCAGWSGPSLSAYTRRHVSHGVINIIVYSPLQRTKVKVDRTARSRSVNAQLTWQSIILYFQAGLSQDQDTCNINNQIWTET